MYVVDIEPGPNCDVHPAVYNPETGAVSVSAPLHYTFDEVLRWLDSREGSRPTVAVVGHAPGYTSRSSEMIAALEARGLTVKTRGPAAFLGSGPDAVSKRIKSALTA